MGKGLMINCKCGCNKILSEGYGFMAPSYRDRIYKEIKNGEQEKFGILKGDIDDVSAIHDTLRNIFNSEENLEFMEYRICYCKKCDLYSSYLHYSITTKAGEIKRTINKCEKCGNEMVHVKSNDIKQITCPECNKTLTLSNGEFDFIRWD